MNTIYWPPAIISPIGWFTEAGIEKLPCSSSFSPDSPQDDDGFSDESELIKSVVAGELPPKIIKRPGVYFSYLLYTYNVLNNIPSSNLSYAESSFLDTYENNYIGQLSYVQEVLKSKSTNLILETELFSSISDKIESMTFSDTNMDRINEDFSKLSTLTHYTNESELRKFTETLRFLNRIETAENLAAESLKDLLRIELEHRVNRDSNYSNNLKRVIQISNGCYHDIGISCLLASSMQMKRYDWSNNDCLQVEKRENKAIPSKYNVEVFPNPTSGVLELKSSHIFEENDFIEIYDSSMKLVNKIKMNNKINVANFNAGIYFIKVIPGNEIIKVVKI